MRSHPQPLSVVFAVLMVLAAAWPGGHAGFAAAAPAAAAVLVGVFFRTAATVAVLLTVAAAAFLDIPAVFAAGSGLSAAAYLITRHAAGRATAAITVPAALGLLGFTAAGLAAVVLPVEPTWVPLLAPAVICLAMVVAAVPLMRGVGPAPAASTTIEPDPAA